MMRNHALHELDVGRAVGITDEIRARLGLGRRRWARLLSRAGANAAGADENRGSDGSREHPGHHRISLQP